MANMNDRPLDEQPRVAEARLTDARDVLSYLVAPEADQYIAIMDVIDASMTDLMPAEIGARLRTNGTPIEESLLETRLDKLRYWRAISARTDSSRILRHADLMARNWRYTATPAGRRVHRFYRNVLAGTPAAREIPLSSLARVVEAAEALATSSSEQSAELVGRLFVNHDDLDTALVGAEDSLIGLVDRFDLNDEATSELKTLLVEYATHVAVELERGSACAHRALTILRPRFTEFANEAVRASDARALIERGALSASRGGRIEDWHGLLGWLDPSFGRATRFALRLVRALPGMHVNLRRLHSSSGTATSHSRALALARACAHPIHGTAVFLAALGDHSWRKLFGEADDVDLTRLCSWRDGPSVVVPELLRITGRAGARGRIPAARDDSAAREAVRQARERRAAEHDAAIREVLEASHGSRLSDLSARVAFASLMAAVRMRSSNGRRTATRDGLACTLFPAARSIGLIVAPTWRILTPGRIPVFHRSKVVPRAPETADLYEEQDEPRILVAGGIE
jgi:hypothetical protein